MNAYVSGVKIVRFSCSFDAISISECTSIAFPIMRTHLLWILTIGDMLTVFTWTNEIHAMGAIAGDKGWARWNTADVFFIFPWQPLVLYVCAYETCGGVRNHKGKGKSDFNIVKAITFFNTVYTFKRFHYSLSRLISVFHVRFILLNCFWKTTLLIRWKTSQIMPQLNHT